MNEQKQWRCEVNNLCPKCYKPYYDEGTSSIPVSLCSCSEAKVGWICALCGRCNSPDSMVCPCQPIGEPK